MSNGRSGLIFEIDTDYNTISIGSWWTSSDGGIDLCITPKDFPEGFDRPDGVSPDEPCSIALTDEQAKELLHKLTRHYAKDQQAQPA